MRSFEEVLAAKNAMKAAGPRSFDDVLAAKQAALTANAEKTAMPAAEKPSFGAEVSDVARSFNTGMTSGMEFLTDVGALPITLSQRIKTGTNLAGSEGEGTGFLDRIKSFGKGFMEPTDFGKRIASNFEPAKRQWAEQIGEGEGSIVLDPLKTGANLFGEALMTAPLGGGGQTGKLAYKTAPLIAAGGATGEAVGGETGEFVGVMTGALSGDFPSMAKLLAKTGGIIKGLPRKLKRSVKSGDTTANASDNEIWAGIDEIVRNAWTGSPEGQIKHVDDLFKQAKAKIAAGEKGTLGQLTGDAGILDFEARYAKEHRAAGGELHRISQDIEQDVYDATGAIVGDAAQAARIPSAVVSEQKKAIEEVSTGVLAKATTAERKAKKKFAAGDTTEVSGRMKVATQKIKDDRFDVAKQAWKDIPDDGQILAEDVVAQSKKVLKAFDDPNMSREFEATFTGTMAAIKRLEGDVSLESLDNIISTFSKETVDSGWSPDRINQFKEGLYDVLDMKVGASQARKDAAKIYRDYQTDFGTRSPLGKALAKGDEEFAHTVIKTGEVGAAKRAEQKRATGGAVEDLSDEYLRTKFAEKHIDKETGAVTPAGVKSFINQYQHQLSDALRSDLNTMRKTGMALEGAQKGAVAAGKEVKALDKTIAGRFARTGSTEREIVNVARELMETSGGKDVTKNLKELLATVSESDPKAKEHIQRAFMDDFENIITTKGGDFKLDSGALAEFKARRSTYEKSGLYTKEQMQVIEDSLVEGQKIYLHSNGPALAKLPAAEKRVAEVVAALTGAKIGAMAFGSPLIGAALGRRYATKQLREMGSDKARKIAFELTMNPQKFEDIIKHLSKPSLSDKEIQKGLTKLFTRAAMGARTEVIGE